MHVTFTMSETELRLLVVRHFEEKTGQSLQAENIHIEVKSKQNFKSEWENADFRASYTGEL